MASFTLPKRGVEYIFYPSLMDASDGTRIKITPTLAAGDVVVYRDGVLLGNINTLPVETPAGSGILKVTLSATEMTADNVVLRFLDQTASAEWADATMNIQPISEPVDANVTDVNGNPVVGGTPDVNVVSTDATERDALADASLRRDWTLVSKTSLPSRCTWNALRSQRNRWTSAAGTLTVYEEDDLTVAWTSALASDAGADPVTGSDPA